MQVQQYDKLLDILLFDYAVNALSEYMEIKAPFKQELRQSTPAYLSSWDFWFNDITQETFFEEKMTKEIENPTVLNKTDRYAHTALNYALCAHNYPLAQQLRSLGANSTLIDRTLLEKNLFLYLQLDPNFMQNLSVQDEDKHSRFLEYLVFLEKYVTKKLSKADLFMRDIMEANVIKLGQALDTRTYTTRGLSYHGFIEVALVQLNDFLKHYTHLAKEYRDAEIHKYIAKISDCFEFTCRTYNFSGNLADDKQISINLKQIANSSYRAAPLILIGGFAGNMVTITLFRDYLIYTNLGLCGTPSEAVKVYNFNTPELFTEDFLRRFSNGYIHGTNPANFFNAFAPIFNTKPEITITQGMGQVDNGVVANLRAQIQAIIYIYNPDRFRDMARSEYVALVEENYCYHTLLLVDRIQDKEAAIDERRDAGSVAIEYINQNHKAKRRRILESMLILRDCLYTYGFGDIYETYVKEGTKDLITKHVIFLQEENAMYAISQEKLNLDKLKDDYYKSLDEAYGPADPDEAPE